MPDEWHDREFVERWDARVSVGNPHRSQQVDIVLTAMRRSVPQGGHVLDLGVGTGLVADEILSRWPDVRLTGIDSSAAALELARDRLQRFADRVHLTQGDMVDDMPQGTFDAVIAFQTMHHITDDAKERALGKVRDRLLARGILLIADRLAMDEAHFAEEIGALGERLEENAEHKGDRSPSHFPERAQHKGDHPLGLEDTLAWLGRGGFHAVCLDLHLDRVVMAARPR